MRGEALARNSKGKEQNTKGKSKGDAVGVALTSAS